MPKKTPTPHGGKRPGAGRVAGPDGKKVAMSIRVPQFLKDFLETQNASEFLTRVAVASKEVKAWRKNLEKSG